MTTELMWEWDGECSTCGVTYELDEGCEPPNTKEDALCHACVWNAFEAQRMAHRHLAAAHRWLNATKEEKTRMAEAERNKEGLTFAEWHTATGQMGSSEKPRQGMEERRGSV